MPILGSPNYRVGLIIARAQPFHNGHLKAITDALMKCDEVIFSLINYDTSYFDYNIAQKVFREIFEVTNRVAFFGIKHDPILGTPKHMIERTLDELKVARYNLPTHFFTNNDDWIEPAKELQLETVKISTLANHNSIEIYNSIIDGTDVWKDKVPYATLETIESYIATKQRNF